MAPKSKTKKAVAGSGDYNEGPAPVWLAQINELWKYGKSPVRLPQVDLRKPGQEKEAVKMKVKLEKEQEQEAGEEKKEENEKFKECMQDGAKAEVATPQMFDNLKYWPANSFTSSLLPSPLPLTSPPPLPSTFHSQLQPQHQTSPQSGLQVKSSVVECDDQGVKTVRASFYRGTRGRGDPRNAGMKEAQARFRAEQAKRQIGLKIPSTQTMSSTTTFGSSKLDQSRPFTIPDSLLNDNMERNTSVELNLQQPQTNEIISDLPNSMILSNQTNHPLPRHSLHQHPRLNGNAIHYRNSIALNNRAYNLPPRPPPQRKPVPYSLSYRQDGAVARRQDDWSTWIELRVKIYGLPANVSTLDIWKCFSKEGSIAAIDIFEDRNGSRDGKAAVRFSPPPAKAFWQVDLYPLNVKGHGVSYVRIELEQPHRSFLIPSPANPQKKYPEIMIMKAVSIDFGLMYDQKNMMSMNQVGEAHRAEIQFRQDLTRREVVVQFQINIRDSRTNPQIPDLGKLNRTEKIRFSIKYPQLQEIYKVRDDKDITELVISLETPPKFFRKLDEVITHEDGSKYWNDNDAWYRQTDIVYDPDHLKKSAIVLRKKLPIIDIGRWTTYRFVFNMQKNDRQRFEMMCDAFRDHNVQIKELSSFNVIKKREPAVWEYIDKPVLKQKKKSSGLAEMIVEDVVPLAFPVRYQLEVCISQGYLNEHNMTKEFLGKLIEMDEIKARDVLEYIANQKKRVFDPMEIFGLNVLKGSASRPKIPHYCAYTRSATVTPSTIYYNSPSVETTNRVIRQYAEYADRFLRVRFSDEKFEGRIRNTTKDTMNEVFTRIKRAMANGVDIGDRHYEFLAFGNSQFRENGAYFFAPTLYLSAAKIRAWMGSFNEIKVVAKYAARIGQCFSTTRAISGSKAKVVEIHDVKRNGFCFTDGVGKLSAFLAQLVALELGIPPSVAGPPSVFQFRLGGCKGVVAVSPDAKSREIHIRPSQYKFAAPHEGLEIIRWSQFATASLNRQLILVLSTLGVPDDIFIQKLKLQLSNLELAMTNEKMALNLLQKDIDANQMTLVIAGMILEGFQGIREPFVTSLLQLWRAWSIKYLKEKAKISINDGALLLGCTDETGKLKGHFDTVPNSERPQSAIEKEKLLPEVFVQLSKGPEDKPWVVKGPMLLARNPSLHPGDIRVVRGVDIPELHYLKDVVAFPQTGDRDLASMCSGGDLDGDDFLVMWDKDLLAHEWNHTPMNYEPPRPLELDREIYIDDITSFFVKYMKNDNLPTIAHAHVAQADDAEDGVKDDKCLELAALHSTAVDYVKSGQPARMPRELVPRRWPHFMEKIHQPKSKTYYSRKILGKLYDQVERIDFVPAFSAPFDKRILDAYELEANILLDAATLKRQYDTAMNRIMAQHEIRTEFEVWSTFVLHHSNESKDYKFHEIIGELSTALKDQFREACYKKAGGKDFEHIGPFVAAMYKVTSEEMVQSLEECHKLTLVGGEETRARKLAPENMPLMSFPWLFQGVLGKIANGAWQVQAIDPATLEQKEVKRTPPQDSKIKTAIPEEEDILETAEGFTHRGELLELFEDNLIDYELDGEETTPMLNQSSGSVKPGSSANNVTIDDMLFGDYTGKIAHHEEDCGQQNYAYTEPIVDNLSGVLPEHRHLSNPVESNTTKKNCDNIVLSSRLTGTITPANPRSNASERLGSYESNSAENDFEIKMLDESPTQNAAEIPIIATTLSSSCESPVNSLSKSDSSPEQDVSDSESEEEIVKLDIKPSLLDQLADFDED